MRRCGVALRCGMVVAFLAAVGGVVSGQATAAGVTVVTSQTGGAVSLKAGAVLEVRLDANHTTGYSWVAAPAANPVLVRQGKAKYDESSAEGKVGAGGVEVWRFKALNAGKQTLQFDYRRPWEKNVPAAKTVVYSVTVE
jgi:inhibitor of cysteine peptidase